MKQKVVVIVGPTASGKSSLAVELAQKCKGAIISADSRQVYRGLNIGTGKITSKEMRGVTHHLLDVADPKRVFTVSDFKRRAEQTIADIAQRGRTPIFCGGTGFYIESVIDGIMLPEVAPNAALRKTLSKKTTEQLFNILKKLDPKRAKHIDAKNSRRLIRAIEIAKTLGNVPPVKKSSRYNTFFIGITVPSEILKKKIDARLRARLKKGMVAEVKKLHARGLSWKRMNALGLEYRYLALYLQNHIAYQEMVKKLSSEIYKYAKRQMTWFKRDKRVQWFSPTEKSKIKKAVSGFLE